MPGTVLGLVPRAHLMLAAVTAAQWLCWVSRGGAESPALPSQPARGLLVPAAHRRTFHWFPDRAVQEARGQSGSPSGSDDIQHCLAELIAALVPTSKH